MRLLLLGVRGKKGDYTFLPLALPRLLRALLTMCDLSGNSLRALLFYLNEGGTSDRG